MPAGHEMRVSDAERDAAAAELREHFASGRLDQEELDQRLTAVFAAKTRGDLNAQFTDLPSGAGAGAASSAQPIGAGTYGGRPFGSGSGSGSGWSGGAGRAFGRVLVGGVLLWALLIIGILGVFGIGTGRPVGLVLIFAAFALLRKLLFGILGRGRGRGRGCGPRGRRRF